MIRIKGINLFIRSYPRAGITKTTLVSGSIQ